MSETESWKQWTGARPPSTARNRKSNWTTGQSEDDKSDSNQRLLDSPWLTCADAGLGQIGSILLQCVAPGALFTQISRSTAVDIADKLAMRSGTVHTGSPTTANALNGLANLGHAFGTAPEHGGLLGSDLANEMFLVIS